MSPHPVLRTRTTKTTTHNSLTYLSTSSAQVDGEMFTQSEAMCRWAASLGDGSLYPRNDAKQCYAIDRMLGLLGDDTRSFMPALYMGMMPHKFGYPEDFAKVITSTATPLLRTYIALGTCTSSDRTLISHTPTPLHSSVHPTLVNAIRCAIHDTPRPMRARRW